MTKLTPAQRLKLSLKIKKIKKDHPEYDDKKVLAVAYKMVKEKGRRGKDQRA